MVKVKAVKAPKVAKSRVPSKSSSFELSNCSPPSRTNGAKKIGASILDSEEQKLYKVSLSEIKQVSALIIMKCGLNIVEGHAIPQ